MSDEIPIEAPRVAHTPGPWAIRPWSQPAFSVTAKRCEEEIEIADLYFASNSLFAESRVECNANAQLIAAAPDLLRENEIAATSMHRIADHIAGDTYLGEFAAELRMIAINLENIARKAKGETN